MGSVGTGEILLILLVALLVLGPERLPGAARQVGSWVREFRTITGGIQAEVRDAMTEVMKPVQDTVGAATGSWSTGSDTTTTAPAEPAVAPITSAPGPLVAPAATGPDEPKAADIALPGLSASAPLKAPAQARPADPTLN